MKKEGTGIKEIEDRKKAEEIKRLSDELNEVFAQATEEYADIERLDAILAALNELDSLDPKEFDPQEGLRRFYKRLAARDADSPPCPKEM